MSEIGKNAFDAMSLNWFGEEDAISADVVQAWLTSNKDKPEVLAMVSSMFPPKPISVDDVSAFLETQEGKDYIGPIMDKRVTSGIETFKKGKFEQEVKARVASEILKMNPQETPEQKRIRDLEERELQRDKEFAEKELRSQIEKLAFKEKIDPEFMEGIRFNSLEEANLYIKRFKDKVEVVKKDTANELVASGYKPGSGTNDNKSTGKLDLSKLTVEEAIQKELAGELDAALI